MSYMKEQILEKKQHLQSKVLTSYECNAVSFIGMTTEKAVSNQRHRNY